jgi:hypothetical protein
MSSPDRRPRVWLRAHDRKPPHLHQLQVRPRGCAPVTIVDANTLYIPSAVLVLPQPRTRPCLMRFGTTRVKIAGGVPRRQRARRLREPQLHHDDWAQLSM